MSLIEPLLRQFIGRTANVEGRSLQIVDWLSSQQAFVYHDQQTTPGAFQETQYGTAGRKVSETFTLHFLNESRTRLHPVLMHFTSRAEATDIERKLL